MVDKRLNELAASLLVSIQLSDSLHKIDEILSKITARVWRLRFKSGEATLDEVLEHSEDPYKGLDK